MLSRQRNVAVAYCTYELVVYAMYVWKIFALLFMIKKLWLDFCFNRFSTFPWFTLYNTMCCLFLVFWYIYINTLFYLPHMCRGKASKQCIAMLYAVIIQDFFLFHCFFFAFHFYFYFFLPLTCRTTDRQTDRHIRHICFPISLYGWFELLLDLALLSHLKWCVSDVIICLGPNFSFLGIYCLYAFYIYKALYSCCYWRFWLVKANNAIISLWCVCTVISFYWHFRHLETLFLFYFYLYI